MTKHPSVLTELEGAVLSEIHHRHHDTAFQVRRAFQTSLSIEWSGSAGAVYPAIRRLSDAGLIETSPIMTGRKGTRLALSPKGVAALEVWICDPVRTTSVGVDPFRLRAGLWATLEPAIQAETFRNLQRLVDEEIERLIASLDGHDEVERARMEWCVQIQQMRSQWLKNRTA